MNISDLNSNQMRVRMFLLLYKWFKGVDVRPLYKKYFCDYLDYPWKPCVKAPKWVSTMKVKVRDSNTHIIGIPKILNDSSYGNIIVEYVKTIFQVNVHENIAKLRWTHELDDKHKLIGSVGCNLIVYNGHDAIDIKENGTKTINTLKVASAKPHIVLNKNSEELGGKIWVDGNLFHIDHCGDISLIRKDISFPMDKVSVDQNMVIGFENSATKNTVICYTIINGLASKSILEIDSKNGPIEKVFTFDNKHIVVTTSHCIEVWNIDSCTLACDFSRRSHEFCQRHITKNGQIALVWYERKKRKLFQWCFDWKTPRHMFSYIIETKPLIEKLISVNGKIIALFEDWSWLSFDMTMPSEKYTILKKRKRQSKYKPRKRHLTLLLGTEVNTMRLN